MQFHRPDTTDPQIIGAAALAYVLEHGHAADLTEADLRHAAAAAIVARAPRDLHPTALDRLNAAADWIARTEIRRRQQLETFAQSCPDAPGDADAPQDGPQPAGTDAPPETDAELCLRALQAILRIAGRPGGDDDQPGGGSRVATHPRPQSPAPGTYAPTPTHQPSSRPPAAVPPMPPAPPAKPAPFDF